MSYRSSVFKAMLTSDMEERRTGEIRFADFELDMGRALLAYIYDSTLDKQADLMALLRFADKYDMPELKERCAKGLAETISPTNYLQVEVFHREVGKM